MYQFISPEEVHAQGMTYPQAASIGKFYRQRIYVIERKKFVDQSLIDHYFEYIKAWREWMRLCFPEQFKG